MGRSAMKLAKKNSPKKSAQKNYSYDS